MPFHNWNHAVRSSQTVKFLLKFTGLNNIFTDCEKLSMIIASFVHDIDHRGKSNNFHNEVFDPLSIVHSADTLLEYHHICLFEQIMTIPECNILLNFNENDKNNILLMVKELILSTSNEALIKFTL